MVAGIALFSGGLDSILAVRLLQDQNIHIEAVAFTTPFFGADTAEKHVRQLGVGLHVIDITEQHFTMLKSPRYGYGKHMNPCIDCHALMFRQAGSLMEKMGAHFIFSGEVLGERPMSQNKNSLHIVARLSGFEDYILRPLSAQLLPVTKPEQEGLVDREKLLAIQGRSRKPQIELARRFGITEYPGPAGGCKLTADGFSSRLKDLLAHDENPDRRDLELLSLGRHLRIHDGCKIIVGRNMKENSRINELSCSRDTVLTTEAVPGPTVLVPGGAADDTLMRAASICARYSDAQRNAAVAVLIKTATDTARIFAVSCSEETIKDCMI